MEGHWYQAVGITKAFPQQLDEQYQPSGHDVLCTL
jgi:hypothetical protein